MWTGTVWMKCIFTVMQQHLKLQELLHKSWGFPKVIFLRVCKDFFKYWYFKIVTLRLEGEDFKFEVTICDWPIFAVGVLQKGVIGVLGCCA